MLLKDKTAVMSGAASKRGIGRATAQLFAEQGARVAILDLDANGAALTPEMKAEVIKGIPRGRPGDARDVANIYLFLASDLSAYVTGAVIDVNGGMLID